MTPPTFAPGDRVSFRVYSAEGRGSTRHAIVTAVPNEYSVEINRHGLRMMLSPDELTLLPPAKSRGPGAGRPTSTAKLRVGDVLAVCDVTPDGATPLRRYVVAAVEDTADGLRVELRGEGGAGMVVVR